MTLWGERVSPPSHYGSAALTNPALLTNAQASDNVSVILPSVGVFVSDPDKVEDKFDRIKSSWDSVKNTLNASSGVTNPLLRRLALQQGISSFQSLRGELEGINGDRAYGDAAAAAVIAVPNQTLPFAFVVKGWGKEPVCRCGCGVSRVVLGAIACGLSRQYARQ